MKPRVKTKTEGGEREGERKGDRLVFLSLLRGMTRLCTAAVFVNQGQGCFVGLLLGEEGGKTRAERRGGEGRGGGREEKRGASAETLSSNSRKRVDPERGRLGLQDSGEQPGN